MQLQPSVAAQSIIALSFSSQAVKAGFASLDSTVVRIPLPQATRLRGRAWEQKSALPRIHWNCISAGMTIRWTALPSGDTAQKTPFIRLRFQASRNFEKQLTKLRRQLSKRRSPEDNTIRSRNSRPYSPSSKPVSVSKHSSCRIPQGLICRPVEC